MIYTLTFNPALDYIVQVSDYQEGAVNRTLFEKILPGGKGINVSIVLHNLGVKNMALGFSAGFTGGEIQRLLTNQGVRNDFIQLPRGNSRINVKLKTGKETEINGVGPEIPKEALEQLFQRLDELKDEDYLVLAGSIPADLPDTIYCDIMKRVADKRIRVTVDAEKELLDRVLPYRPFLIKPNHHELGDMFGTELHTLKEAAHYAGILRERGARNVLVSMAGDGGILAAESGEVFYSPAPQGKLVNSTGAGDSTVAGFLAGFLVSKDYGTAFLTGLCAGSASAFSEELAVREDVEILYQQMKKDEKVSMI